MSVSRAAPCWLSVVDLILYEKYFITSLQRARACSHDPYGPLWRIRQSDSTLPGSSGGLVSDRMEAAHKKKGKQKREEGVGVGPPRGQKWREQRYSYYRHFPTGGGGAVRCGAVSACSCVLDLLSFIPLVRRATAPLNPFLAASCGPTRYLSVSQSPPATRQLSV
jgi:hypothetical protein